MLIMRSTNTKGIGSRLLDVNIIVILVASTVMAGLSLLPAIRWRMLVQSGGRAFGTSDSYRLILIGNFFGQVLPSTVGGDGIRAWYTHKFGIPVSEAVNSVLLDRLTALAALLLLTFCSLPWLWLIVPIKIAWWTIGIILLAAMGGVAFPFIVTRLPDTWNRWRIVRVVYKLADSCQNLFRRKQDCFKVIGLSLVVHLAIAVFIYGLARTVHVPVYLGDCILLIPLVMLVSMMPVSIGGGWGVREGAMVVAFGFLEIPPGDALLVSILFGVVVALASMPGLFFWMIMGKKFGKGEM